MSRVTQSLVLRPSREATVLFPSHPSQSRSDCSPTPFTKGPSGPISSSHPPPHTDITLFAPRIHLVPDEVNGIHTTFHALETRIDAITNDRIERQGPTNVHLFYFHGRVTVRENDVIKNTRKMAIDPQFRLFPCGVLASSHDVHFSCTAAHAKHGPLRSHDWAKVQKFGCFIEIVNHALRFFFGDIKHVPVYVFILSCRRHFASVPCSHWSNERNEDFINIDG